tara:strand:- start:139 stop:2139 length:2001 start_codon:yes stop_codon:yes gene_type:complete
MKLSKTLFYRPQVLTLILTGFLLTGCPNTPKNTPPNPEFYVTGVVPAESSNPFPSNLTQITFTFSDEVSEENLSSDQISFIEDQNNQTISFTLSSTGNTITLELNEALTEDHSYTVTLSKTIESTSGETLDEDYVLRFSTQFTPDLTGPRLISSNPQDGQDEVNFDHPIELVFDEPISIANQTLITLNAQGTPVAVELEVIDGDTLVISAPDFREGTNYTALVSAGAIVDMAGNENTDLSLNFSTRTRTWDAATSTVFSSSETTILQPASYDVAMVNGNVEYFWVSVQNGTIKRMNNRTQNITLDQMSGSRNLYYLIGANSIFAPKATANANGHVAVAWTVRDTNGIDDVYVNERATSENEGWGSPFNVDDATDFSAGVVTPSISLNDQGDMAVAWQEQGNLGAQLSKARVYTAENNTWSVVQSISQSQSATLPTIELSNSGEAAALYRDFTDGNLRVWGNTRNTSGLWGTPVQLQGGSQSASQLQLLSSETGFSAFWRANQQIFVNTQQNDAWLPVEVNLTGATAIQINSTFNVSQNNNHFALARIQDTSGLVQVQTWDESPLNNQIVENASSQNIKGLNFNPIVEMNHQGDVTVVWTRQEGSLFRVFANRKVNGTWGVETPLSEVSDFFPDPRIAMAANGQAVVLWLQTAEGSDQIDLVSRILR